MTNCTQVELWLAAREVDTLTPEDDESLRKHLLGCATCRELAGFGEAEGFGSLETVDRDRYRFGAELARGGMGSIRAAEDRRLGREVAIKELLAEDSTALQLRFEREAMITARLQHPAIVPVYEAGRWPGGKPFYAMKRVRGRSLFDVIGDTETLGDRLALLPNVIAIAEAVAFAHDRGVIHRDLKPDNVLVGDYGETVVIDWGLAKDLGAGDDAADDDIHLGPYRDQAPHLTRAGAVIGTPAYMPPEQARGEAVDARADVYAVGAILYHALAGAPPYQGSGDEVLAALLEDAPAPLADRAPGAPRDLVTIVDKAMARDAGDRYADAGELADDLRKFQTGQLVGAHDYSGSELFSRWVRRNKRPVAVAAAAALALAVGGALSVSRIAHERDQATAARAAAETAQRASDDTANQLLVEQGRRDLLAGRPDHAAVYLSAVYSRGVDSPALRFMLAEALRPIRALRGAVPARVDDPVQVFMSQVSADGALVATTPAEGLLVWDVTREKAALTVGGDGFHIAQLFPDHRRVMGATRQDVGVWDIETKKLVYRHRAPSGLRRAALTRDGRWLIVLSNRALEVRAANTGQSIAKRSLEGITSGLNLSASGTIAVTYTANNQTAHLWRLPTLEPLASIPGIQPAPPNLPGRSSPVSPDDTRVLVMPPGGVAVYRVDGTLSWKKDIQGQVIMPVFSPDGDRVLLIAGRRFEVRDARTGDLVCSGEAPGVPALASYTGSGSLIHVYGLSAGTTATHDGTTCMKVHETPGGILGDQDASIALRHRARRLDVVATDVSALAGAIPGSPWVAVSHQRPQLLTAKDGEPIRVFDARTGEPQYEVPGGVNVGASPELFVTAADSTLELRRLEDGAVVGTIPRPDDPFALTVGDRAEGVGLKDAAGHLTVYAADGTRLGRSLASSGCQWANLSGRRIVTLRNCRGELWSTDGTRVAHLAPEGATADRVFLSDTAPFAVVRTSDGRATLLDTETGERLATIADQAPDIPLYLLYGASPDGSRLTDGHQVWATDTGDVLATLEGTDSYELGSKFVGNHHVARPGGQGFGGVWSADTGQSEVVFRDREGVGYHILGASGDAEIIAATASNDVVELRDRRTGVLLKRLPVPGGGSVTKTASGASWSLPFPWFVDGDSVLVIKLDSNPLLLWRIERETATPDEVAALVRARVPLRLEDGRIVGVRSGPAKPSSFDDAWRNQMRADLFDCSRLPAMRATGDGVATEITFANHSDNDIFVRFIDASGTVLKRAIDRVAAHGEIRHKSMSSHSFVVEDASGACIEIVRPLEGPSRYVYTSDRRPDKR